MGVVDKLFTNTILVPTTDSLVSGHPLADTSIGKDIEAYNNSKFDETQTVDAKQFQVYIVSGGKSVMAGVCEQIDGLSVKREAETKMSGGNGDYLVKLPGKISYGEVNISNFYCDNDAFMNWMINGTQSGGVQKADIEIRIGKPGSAMVYTLRDSFPIKWYLGTMSVNAEGLVTKKETVTYTISEDQIMVENVTIAYGRLDYKREK